MIFQEGGRWRSERTASERNTEVQEILDKLTPQERVALEAVIGEFQNTGQSEIANTCANLEWEETPVPIETWLNSHDLIGDTGETIYPVLKNDIIELFTGNYHEVILCLHPDTRVPLLDGSTATIKELAERWVKDPTPFWVYSYIDGVISPALAEQPRQTGVDDYYRVTLDDGTSFTGNSRHQMLRRDGTKVMIRDMRTGDSLMPFEVGLSAKADGDRIGNHYVVKVEKIGRGPVYCMTVPTAGNFAISTGKEGKTTRCGVFSSNTGSIGWG